MVAKEAFLDLDAPVERLTMPDIPSPHNPVLLEAAVPSVERIRDKIHALTVLNGRYHRGGGSRRLRADPAGRHQSARCAAGSAVGDAVREGDPLVELETDKVTVEVSAPACGTLSRDPDRDRHRMRAGAVLGRIGMQCSTFGPPPLREGGRGRGCARPRAKADDLDTLN